jgi:hypothetical protein
VDAPSSLVPARCAGLVNKIHAGECVLVLGPRISMPAEVCGDTQTPIDDYLTGRLLDDLGEERGNTSLREALTRYEQRAGASALRSFYQQLVGELDPYSTELHRNLATLPFRLVLLATPDRMMFNAFTGVGRTGVREAHYDYCRGAASDMPLSLPSSDKPILYSLFGRHDRPESMVLTDKNLLDYLVRLTKESPPLPDPVRATLRAPSTLFLFVGFGFTNWWLRLLLKVLDVTGVENRSLSLALEDSSSFAATATRENKGFFEAAGIYIQAGDWSALARELASRYRDDVKRETQAKPAAAGSAGGRRPLVFLSYASEDADTVNGLRRGLEDRGVSVWQDSQNLRAGQNWEAKIEEFIKRVDYFVFVQTENMDQRDDRREDGVYNRELKFALKRAEDRPYGAVFVLHVTVGHCRTRPEPELRDIHRVQLDGDPSVDALASQILQSFASGPGVVAVSAEQTA